MHLAGAMPFQRREMFRRGISLVSIETVDGKQRMQADHFGIAMDLGNDGCRADWLTTMGFDGCKVAFVDNGNEQLSMHEHIAILAREHGILAAVFSEESAATIWLRHGEE